METGIVIKSTGSWYQVRKPDGTVVECRIRGKLRTKGLRTTNPVAVGDNVDFNIDEKTNQGLIESIGERRNYIIRKSINLSKEAHILAANIDQAILVVTLVSPRTFTQFIDRFLATAEAYQIPSILIFNKIDLYGDELKNEMESLIKIYETIGYKCIRASVANGIGIDEIDAVTCGKLSLLAGHSGVGKSTIANRLNPNLELRTSAISDSHDSGMHTTTYPEMHPLLNGGYIIDSPGIKGFGSIDMSKDEISHYFPEMFAESANCQFYNCTHTHEPKCAVKQAVAEGRIAQSRYNSYLSLLNDEDEDKYRQGVD
ncbi:MAG: ribosome small subunit-dependent GTPase A [Salinivirgaceae bacterium]|nr:ribosome small subunit-dependent GTPase A [Salinivirgaceae bacterium]